MFDVHCSIIDPVATQIHNCKSAVKEAFKSFIKHGPCSKLSTPYKDFAVTIIARVTYYFSENFQYSARAHLVAFHIPCGDL